MRVALFYNPSVPQTTGHYVRRGLQTLCHVDVWFPHQSEEVIGSEYDLFICVDDSSHYLFPSKLKPSALWIIDSHLSYWADLIMARRFDYVFAANKADAGKFTRDGITYVTWLPLGCEQETHGKCPAENKRYDVAFIGNDGWGRRRHLLNRVRKEFPNSYIGSAPYDEIGKVYSQAKIVFNCGWSNDLNMRVFEALCSGTCLVTNSDAAGLTDLFLPGKHLVTYSGEEEAIETVKHYLSHEGDRERIALEGMNEALKSHTYSHRVQRMIQVMQSEKNARKIRYDGSNIYDLADRLALRALDRLYKARKRFNRRFA